MTRTWTAAIALCVVLAPSPARAQGSSYAAVSLSTTQTYEDNIFAASRAEDRVSDVAARVAPALEGGYVSRPFTVIARYGFGAERYFDHPAFSRRLARQDAGIELRHQASRRLALDVKAAYLETQRPYEFNLETTGLVAGRARAERLHAGAIVAYDWTPVRRVNVDYAFTKDALNGGFTAEYHDAGLGLERHAVRSSRRLDYRFRQFSFGDDWSDASHVFTAGWSRNLTRRTSIELSLGPRLSRGRVRPEFAAAARRRLQNGALSASYSRTQATAIGASEAIDVQRVVASLAFEPARRITLSAAPAFSASAYAGGRVSVYALDMQASGRTRRGLTVVLSGRVGLQRGTRAGRREDISYRSVSLGLSATLPRTERARRAGESR